MQAGAMGLPSIVSNINGCNEIIKEQENGLIIPVKDKVALFEAMNKTLTQTEVTNVLKDKARAMIVNRYEQQLVWQAILAEYQKFDKS